MDFKNLMKKICEPKASGLLPNLCDFHTKIHILGMDLTIYMLAYGFLFFVTSISG
jgi:hypothetical protein